MTKAEVIVPERDIFQVNSRSGGEGKKWIGSEGDGSTKLL